MHSNVEFVNEICKFVFSSVDRSIFFYWGKEFIIYWWWLWFVDFMLLCCCVSISLQQWNTRFVVIMSNLWIFPKKNIVISKSLRRLWSAHVPTGQWWSTCSQMEQLKCLIVFGAIRLYCISSYFHRISKHDWMFANVKWWP